MLLRGLLAVSLGLLLIQPAGGIEITARVKAVATWLDADNQDSVAQFGVNPAYGANLDGRLTLIDTFGTDSPWSWELAAEVTSLQGDVVENADLFQGQSSGETATLVNDRRRAINLTGNISTGSRHAINARLDRAAIIWQRGQWRARLGRQALSLGSGLVFNPMDIFSPFAPTATDRDFKTGDDALVVTRLGNTGSELELIGVARRKPGDIDPLADTRGNQNSYGLRYRSTLGSLEYELVGARHFDAEVAMFSLSGPVGGAVWRVNWVVSHAKDEVTHSVVANLDYAFGFREQAGYAFVELYHNGYGSNQAAENINRIDNQALERLNRGELFVLEKNYAAIGTSLGLSPLLNFTTTAIVNLQDGAPLVQSAFSYTAGDNTTIEFGAIVPTGGNGDEFGGVVVAERFSLTEELPQENLLTGTSKQLYLRFVRFF